MYRTCRELMYVLQTTRELVLDTKVDIHGHGWMWMNVDEVDENRQIVAMGV